MSDTQPNMSFNLRPANIRDARAIAEVSVATWRSAFRGVMPVALLDGLSVVAREANFQTVLSEEPSGRFMRTAVAEVGDHIVGFVTCGACRDKDATETTGEILGVYILQEFWGRGIGSALLSLALTALTDQGYTVVTLWTLQELVRTIEFYKTAGFTLDGATRAVERSGTELTHVRMRKSIAKT